MIVVRGIVKLVVFFLVVSGFIVVSFVVRTLLRTETSRRHFYTRWVSLVCQFGIWFLNLRVKFINVPDAKNNFLFVGNHLGILDVIVLAAVRPSLFVTSVEMQQTPFLGLICEMGGCLFVERRSRANIMNEIQKIREALLQGLSIALYPEGTSTNGEKVLPFKKSLLTAAAGTGVPILPMVINYKRVNGEPISVHNRDWVFWYGDQTFPPVLWRLMTLKEAVVELEFLNEVIVTDEEQRREVAALAQGQIEAKFRPVLP